MVTRPAVHPPSTTVAEIRAFFEDDHMHIALLVDRGRVVGTIERADLGAAANDLTPARNVAALHGRMIGPDVALADAMSMMKRTGRRRLAVTTDGSALLGLLCLKASGRGFCSDDDVAARSQARSRL
jgi:CBS domain-containing protein